MYRAAAACWTEGRLCLVGDADGGSYLGTMVMYAAFLPWLGVREPLWATIMLAGFALAALLSHLDTRGKGARLELAVLAASFASVFASSRMFGAFVLVPTFVLGNTLGFALTPSRRRRVGYIAVGVLAFLAPAVLERVGASRRPTSSATAPSTIVPRMHELPPEASWLAVVVITIVSTVLALRRNGARRTRAR